jgi:YVTN family beta-propeller protein
LTLINPALGNNVTDVVSVGFEPVAVSYSSDLIYVANSGSNTVSVLSSSTDQNITTLSVGSDPDALAYDPYNECLYIANYNSSNVSVMDNAFAIAYNITVGQGPDAIVYDPDVQTVFIASFDSGTISEVVAPVVVVGGTSTYLASSVSYSPVTSSSSSSIVSLSSSSSSLSQSTISSTQSTLTSSTSVANKSSPVSIPYWVPAIIAVVALEGALVLMLRRRRKQ